MGELASPFSGITVRSGTETKTTLCIKSTPCELGEDHQSILVEYYSIWRAKSESHQEQEPGHTQKPAGGRGPNNQPTTCIPLDPSLTCPVYSNSESNKPH